MVTYRSAKAQCEADGSFLAIPRSEAENDFIAGLIPHENIWIGINDIEEEGKFVAVDGSDISYTNWHPKEPSGTGYRGDDEDGVEIRGYDDQTNWNDKEIHTINKFICSKSVDNWIK